MRDPGRIRVGAVVYFGFGTLNKKRGSTLKVESIPCHILDVPAQDAIAQGAFNEDTSQVILAPFDGGRAADVPTSPVPYAGSPTAGAWSFSK